MGTLVIGAIVLLIIQMMMIVRMMLMMVVNVEDLSWIFNMLEDKVYSKDVHVLEDSPDPNPSTHRQVSACNAYFFADWGFCICQLRRGQKQSSLTCLSVVDQIRGGLLRCPGNPPSVGLAAPFDSWSRLMMMVVMMIVVKMMLVMMAVILMVKLMMM